jgi:hypothetical protein
MPIMRKSLCGLRAAMGSNALEDVTAGAGRDAIDINFLLLDEEIVHLPTLGEAVTAKDDLQGEQYGQGGVHGILPPVF